MDCTRLLRWNCKTFITIVGVSLCVISVVSAQPVRDDSDIVATFRGGTLTLGQVRAHIFMTKTKELAFSKDLVMERVWSDPQRRMRGIETVAFDTMLGTYARQNNIPLSAEQEPFYKAERDLLFSRMYYEEKVKPVIEQERATFKPGYRSYYESHLNDYRLPDRYSYRQVVLSASSEAGWEQLTKSKLEDALQRIVNGEDFREIAQGISSATESPKGSVIGPVESTEVEPEFR
ncbi:MAG TPA: peptidylprolyl isomerase, partial [bacterium]|nr:peptidylprolyl isomerase [bacterium]